VFFLLTRRDSNPKGSERKENVPTARF
jgi:hypothetical protein